MPRRRGAIYCERGGEQQFLVRDVFDMFSKRKPHQILLMVSSHPIVEGDSLLRSELLAMTSYMKWKMRVMEREQSLVCPVSTRIIPKGGHVGPRRKSEQLINS